MKKHMVFLLMLIMIFSSCGTETKEDITESTDVSAVSSECVTETTAETESVPFVSDEDEVAKKILSEMTQGEKVGQLFLARNPKTADEGLAMI